MEGRVRKTETKADIEFSISNPSYKLTNNTIYTTHHRILSSSAHILCLFHLKTDIFPKWYNNNNRLFSSVKEDWLEYGKWCYCDCVWPREEIIWTSRIPQVLEHLPSPCLLRWGISWVLMNPFPLFGVCGFHSLRGRGATWHQLTHNEPSPPKGKTSTHKSLLAVSWITF